MKEIKNDYKDFPDTIADYIFPCQNISQSFQAFQSLSSTNKTSLNHVIHVKYDLSSSLNRKIDFLADYSNFLKEKDIKDKFYENFKNKKKLKPPRNDLQTNAELPKINLEFGNYDESTVLKNFSRRKRQRKNKSVNETISKKEKTNSEESPRKKRKLEYTPFEVINTINTNIRDSSNFDETESKNRLNSLSGLRKTDNVQENDDDQVFDNILKEFLKINDLPKESKDKLTLLKKFIPIYKRVRNDSNKFYNFSKKISENLLESVEEITGLFHFEYLKNRSESSFICLTKAANKFSNCLVLNSFKLITRQNIAHPEAGIMDKLNILKNKISDYTKTLKDILKLFHKEEANSGFFSKLILKFIPAFKLRKFIIEEGKDKISKKIKESLTKNNIIVDEEIFSLLIPSQKEFEVVDGQYNFDYWENLKNQNEEEQFKTDLAESRDLLMKTIENLPKISVLEMPIIKPDEFMTKSLDGIVIPLSKMPILSKKYIIKQFDRHDFAGDD